MTQAQIRTSLLVILAASLLAGCASPVPPAATPLGFDETAGDVGGSTSTPENSAFVFIDTTLETTAIACVSDWEYSRCVSFPRRPGTLIHLRERNLTHAQLSLSWDAASPMTERIGLAILAESAAGERRVFCLTLGASPIELECEPTPVRAGETYALGVFPAHTFSGYDRRMAVGVATNQPVHIEGTLANADASS